MTQIVGLMENVAPVGRRWRRPKHPFNLKTRPFQIQPFFIAPVLPGDTLKNLLMQSRVVSSPIANPLIGWWKEYYFFYVKHRDLDIRQNMIDMVLNYDKDMSSLASAADAKYYHAGNINFAKECLKRVTEEYFRDEAEGWLAGALDGLPMAQAVGHDSNVFDSWIYNNTAGDLPDVDPNDLNEQQETLVRQKYEFMRDMGFAKMSYDDFLRDEGVAMPPEQNKPELVRYIREWTYPTNTVDPVTGAPSSALSWSIEARADKDRFIREPGFLFGVTVTRPKLYLKNQAGTFTSFLTHVRHWLPNVINEAPETTLIGFNASPATSPVSGQAAGHWVDMKDLFLYGEQFVNYAVSAAASSAALPNGDNLNYPTSADIDALFKSGTANTINEDGVVALQILGKVQETT